MTRPVSQKAVQVPREFRDFGRIEAASKELATAPRGLTLNQSQLDWRATVNGTRNPRTATQRALQPGEGIPPGDPRRYMSQRGYVRLRWLVGPQQYVEAYEHRVVMGMPDRSVEIHHINGMKTDNRRENLVALSKSDHALLHAMQKAETYIPHRKSRKGYKGTEALAKTARAEANRAAIIERSLSMRLAYESGLTTTEVGALFGLDSSRVSVHLRRVGTTMRHNGKRS